MFNSPFIRVKDAGEKNSGEIRVEKAGYIPAKVQIENIMRSGESLFEYRKALSQGYEGSNDEEAFANHDPTNELDFDIISADKLLKSESKRLDAKYGSDNTEKPNLEKKVESGEDSKVKEVIPEKTE